MITNVEHVFKNYRMSLNVLKKKVLLVKCVSNGFTLCVLILRQKNNLNQMIYGTVKYVNRTNKINNLLIAMFC